MNTLDAIMSRRSTRKYKPWPVEPEKLETVLQAGFHGPAGGSSKSRHFIVITRKEVLDHLGELVAKEFAAMDPERYTHPSIINSIAKSRQGGYVFHYDPPALIVMASKRSYANNLADCACSLENMMLAANALDLGSCWINQLHWLDEHQPIREYLYTLGLAEDETVCGALSLGYADTENGLPPRRRDTVPENTVTYITD